MRRASFVFDSVRKSAGSFSAGIGIQIKESDVPVEGRWSVMVEEAGYIQNDIRISRGGKKSYSGGFVYKDHIIHELETLTVKIALHLTFSKYIV